MSQTAQHSSVIHQFTDSPATGGRCFLMKTLRNIAAWTVIYVVCKEFQQNVILSFLSPPLPSCPLTTGLFPSPFELCRWQLMSSLAELRFSEQLPRPRPCGEPPVLHPAARQTDELGDRKWSPPVRWAFFFFFFFKALGIGLTFQLWMCVRLIMGSGCAPNLRWDLFMGLRGGCSSDRRARWGSENWSRNGWGV